MWRTGGVRVPRFRHFFPAPLQHATSASYRYYAASRYIRLVGGVTCSARPASTQVHVDGSDPQLFEKHVTGRRLAEAKKDLQQLIEQSQPIPVRPLRALIKMIAHDKSPDEALRLLRTATPLQGTPNEDLYRPIFLKFSQAGRSLDMMRLCEELRTSLGPADLPRSLNMTLASLLRKSLVNITDRATFTVARPEQAGAAEIQEFLQLVESVELSYDTYLYNAMLQTCLDQGRDTLFSQIFHRLRKTGRPDIVSFTLLLRSYVNRNEGTKLLQMLQILRNFPYIQLDEEFLASLAQALMQHGHSEQVTTLLRHIATRDESKVSLKEDVNEYRVCSKAMAILLKNGREDLGQRLFDYVRKYAEQAPPAVLTSIYNQMLDYYGSRDATISMKKIIESMEQHYSLIQWDHFTVTTILKYPDTFPGILSTADEFLLSNPQSVDMPLLNGMIRANRRLGHYERALELFHELCDESSNIGKRLRPDHFSYDNAVACYLAQGDYDKAKALIEEMEENFQSHGMARVALISKLCEELQFDRANKELDAALALFSLPEQRTELFVPFLRAYGKLDNMKKIDHLLERMKETRVPLSAKTCNALLSYYTHSAPERVDNVLHVMRKQGIPFNKETFDIVESYFYRSGSQEELEQWQEERASCGISPSLESYNQKIKHLVESSTVYEAEKVISEMKSKGVHPSSSSYEPFLDYTSQHERLSSEANETLRFRSKNAATGKTRAPASIPAFLEYHKDQPLAEVWDSMIKRGLLHTDHDFDQLLLYYNQKKRFRSTVEFFAFMKKQSSRLIGPTHYRQLIFAYASLGLSGHVEKVMKGMDGMGIQPTVEDYNNLIFAFSQAQKFETAIVVYRQMEGEIKPDRGTFTRLIQGAVLTGRMADAVEFFAEMKLHGFAPNLNAFLSLIFGYAKRGEIDLMMATYESMEGNDVAPDYRILHMILEAIVASVARQEKGIEPLEKDVALMEEQQAARGASHSQESWLSATTDHARFIMDEMERFRIEPDDALASTVLKYYLASDRLRAALDAVDRLSQYQYIKPTALYVMLFCHYQQKDPEIVTNLIRRMRAAGLEMDRHLRTFMHTPTEQSAIARWRFLIRADLPATYFAEQYQDIL